jgi:hypothetical protein
MRRTSNSASHKVRTRACSRANRLIVRQHVIMGQEQKGYRLTDTTDATHRSYVLEAEGEGMKGRPLLSSEYK